MKVRTRQRERKIGGGVAWWYGPPPSFVKYTTYRSRPFYRETLTDSYDKKVDIFGRLPISPCNHLVIRAPLGIPRMSGNKGTSPSSVRLRRLLVEGGDFAWKTVSAHNAKDKGNTYYVTRMLEQTNPFRPQYSVPIAVREMLELTQLFKLAVGSLARMTGSSYLNVKFGWESTLSDLRAAAGLYEAVYKRVKEIRDLSGRGVSRHVFLDSYSTTQRGTSDMLLSTADGVVAGRGYTRYTKTKVSGFVRWRVAPGAYTVLDDLTPLESFNKALRVVLDLDEVTAATVWEMIPFSWLVDYLIDIGSALNASRGLRLAEPTDICINRVHTQELISQIYKKPSWMTVSPMTYKVIGRRFVRECPSKTWQVPTGIGLLSKGQYATLLALISKWR